MKQSTLFPKQSATSYISAPGVLKQLSDYSRHRKKTFKPLAKLHFYFEITALHLKQKVIQDLFSENNLIFRSLVIKYHLP